MTFKDMKLKDWKPYGEQLKSMLDESTNLDITRISRVDGNIIALDGGNLPATFNTDTGTLRVWSRASRYSGGSMSAHQVLKVQEVCRDWKRINNRFEEVFNVDTKPIL